MTSPAYEPITMTETQWRAEAIRRFGADSLAWRFVCPVCGHEAAVADWKAAGASPGEAGFSCVGRHVEGARKAFGEAGPGPCNYAGGGLFQLNPVTVQRDGGGTTCMFAFAPTTHRKEAPEP